MAAEHIYKMLLAESKKRKREDRGEEPGEEAPVPKASSRRKTNKPKTAEKWGVTRTDSYSFFSTYLLEIAGVCLKVSWGLVGPRPRPAKSNPNLEALDSIIKNIIEYNRIYLQAVLTVLQV